MLAFAVLVAVLTAVNRSGVSADRPAIDAGPAADADATIRALRAAVGDDSAGADDYTSLGDAYYAARPRPAAIPPTSSAPSAPTTPR